MERKSPINAIQITDGDIVQYETRGGMSLCRVVEHTLGDPIGALIPITVCDACGVGEIDPPLIHCPECISRAMHSLQIRDALDHLIQGDERIAAVIAYDEKEACNARGQYITIWDLSRDSIGDTNAEELIANWAPMIVNALRAMGASS